MPVSALLQSVSSSELTEWGLYLKLKNDEQEKAQKEAERKAHINSRRR
jgi:hypothetical protein